MRERIVSFFLAAFIAMHELGKGICTRDDETSNGWYDATQEKETLPPQRCSYEHG